MRMKVFLVDDYEVVRSGMRRSVSYTHLTATEFSLLRLFLLNPRLVLSKEQIIDHVWHYDFGGNANIVERCV